MEINTVTGSVADSALGITLMHEHLYVNLMQEYRETGLINDANLLLEEIGRFQAAGGRTIVDVTPAQLTGGASPDGSRMAKDSFSALRVPGRTRENLSAVRELAQRADVNVVLGTAHYRDPYLGPARIDEWSTDQIAEAFVLDIVEGFASGVAKAGIIGEIGADKWFISAREERCFRAAARAQRETGVAVTTHAARWPVGIAQLDLLEDEGVDPSRVIIGHCDTVPILEYHADIARRGAYVQFDCIRNASEYHNRQAVRFIMELIRAGYHDHILLSHDVCITSHLSVNGGPGYAYLLEGFKERLLRVGLVEEEIRWILVDNTRRALAG